MYNQSEQRNRRILDGNDIAIRLLSRRDQHFFSLYFSSRRIPVWKFRNRNRVISLRRFVLSFSPSAVSPLYRGNKVLPWASSEQTDTVMDYPTLGFRNFKSMYHISNDLQTVFFISHDPVSFALTSTRRVFRWRVRDVFVFLITHCRRLYRVT